MDKYSVSRVNQYRARVNRKEAQVTNREAQVKTLQALVTDLPPQVNSFLYEKIDCFPSARQELFF